VFAPDAILGIFRHLCLLATRRRIEVTGGCLRCGACCRGLVLQADGQWISSERHFLDVCKLLPEYHRFTINKTGESGVLIFSCRFYSHNGCTDYPNRPEFCRAYPSAATYLLGQNLLSGCGFRFQAVPR
jgi:uncharacterized protein